MSYQQNTYMLGKYLRLLREDKGVKQEEVAEAISVTRATYSHYENNRIIPPTEILVKLSSYYSVDLDKLVEMAVKDKQNRAFGIEGSTTNSLDAEEIMYYYHRMADDDLQLIKMIVKDFYKQKVKKNKKS